MKPSVIIVGLFIVNGCAVLNTMTSCNGYYQRYKDWREHLEKATENYNVTAHNLTAEEKKKHEDNLIKLQINVNDALVDFQDCKRSQIQGSGFY